MDAVAFIYGETFIYWSAITTALAAAVAVCIFLAFYLAKSRNGLGAALAVPLSVIASIVLSRLVHWYCRADSYESFETAMTDYSSGGYALMGAFFGCLAVGCLLRLARIVRSLPQMLDCMALGAAAGIGVGRLAALFTSDDRGMLLQDITQLPLAYPVTDAVTGQVQYRLATFLLQAIACGVIFAVLALFYILRTKNHPLKNGDIALLFFALYGAVQIVLDSTRYDSLFLRSNGFVSIVQILSAAALVIPVIVFSVWMVLANRWRWWYLGLWLPVLACLGGAGYMEYYVQRHGNEAQFAYTVMSACLSAVLLIMLIIRFIAVHAEKRNRTPSTAIMQP